MKIAIPYDNGNVFQHFGRAEAFKYYTVEDGQIIPGEVVSTGGISHEALADLLSGNGVDLVICGGLGDGAKRALDEAGISVLTGAEGSADDAAASYVRGELTDSAANCNHEEESCGHGEDGCGHECGGCGGGCGGGCCGGWENAEPIMEGRNVGKTVRVHYEGTFNDGSVFDSSYTRGEPMEFICGVGQMIRGFDQAVADMEQGEIRHVHLMPEEAYGMPDPNAILTFAIRDLPGSENLQIGQRVHLHADNGQVFPVRVTARDEENITLDANHEMAGRELNFKIELVEIL
jgi:FKBP-type peptidyl-prolyl cis-trans isomerase 2/predicted Fe-Mo cluster-binding NifX family protein